MSKNILDEIKIVEIPENIAEIFSLKGRTSVITGGASGLGEAIALGLAGFGSDIMLLDMNVHGLERVKKRIDKLGVECNTYQVDVTDIQSMTNARDKIVKNTSEINILINSAGMNIRKPILELEVDEYRKVIDVNLTGTFISCKVFGEIMVNQGKGSIINLASIHGHIAMERQGGYASSKGGIIQLTKVLALEWAKHNVRVNALSPAHHKTPLVEEMVKNDVWYHEIVSRIPLDRFGEAYEIIGPIIFLASDASSFTTGIPLLTDGGWTAI